MRNIILLLLLFVISCNSNRSMDNKIDNNKSENKEEFILLENNESSDGSVVNLLVDSFMGEGFDKTPSDFKTSLKKDTTIIINGEVYSVYYNPVIGFDSVLVKKILLSSRKLGSENKKSYKKGGVMSEGHLSFRSP